jgi:hypothetical protein
MNVFEYASKCEFCFEQFLLSVGKERKTTFYSDLSIAEWYGSNGIKDTYNIVMESWGEDLEFMCEWVIALNQKIWQLYKTNPELAKTYDELWRKADEYCMGKFKGDDLIKYLNYVD